MWALVAVDMGVPLSVWTTEQGRTEHDIAAIDMPIGISMFPITDGGRLSTLRASLSNGLRACRFRVRLARYGPRRQSQVAAPRPIDRRARNVRRRERIDPAVGRPRTRHNPPCR